jgi:hypothetical protein
VAREVGTYDVLESLSTVGDCLEVGSVCVCVCVCVCVELFELSYFGGLLSGFYKRSLVFLDGINSY